MCIAKLMFTVLPLEQHVWLPHNHNVSMCIAVSSLVSASWTRVTFMFGTSHIKNGDAEIQHHLHKVASVSQYVLCFGEERKP